MSAQMDAESMLRADGCDQFHTLNFYGRTSKKHPEVDHFARKEAMFQSLDVVITKQGTVILMVSLLTRSLA